jgi:hypothetical protein
MQVLHVARFTWQVIEAEPADRFFFPALRAKTARLALAVVIEPGGTGH